MGVLIEIFTVIDCKLEQLVTPFVGVLIEIERINNMKLFLEGHSLRGSVD